MQNVFDVGSAPTTPSSGVLIHCSDAHLTKIGNRAYVDSTRGASVQISLPPTPPGIDATDTPCGGWMQGFAYKGVIVLCNDGVRSAFTQSRVGGPALGKFRTTGNLLKSKQVQSNGIDETAQFMSSKILHELMHVAAEAAPFGPPRQCQ